MVGLTVILLAAIVVICVPNLSNAQTITNGTITNNTKSNNNTSTFHSAFDTPGSVNGYGVYQPHNSSIFRPGEKIVLYIEPLGYSYKPIGSMFLMNFTGDLLISDKAGHVLGGFQNLPLSTIISHHKIKN